MKRTELTMTFMVIQIGLFWFIQKYFSVVRVRIPRDNYVPHIIFQINTID